MKKILKILAIIVSIIILAIVTIALWVNFSATPKYEIYTPELTAVPDSSSVVRGSKIVTHVCASCHLGSDGKLSGKLFTNADSEFGEIWSANITQNSTVGIGDYADQELFYLIRTGIKRDGHFAGPYMTRVHISDEDIISIINFLKSDSPLVAPSDAQHPKPNYSFLVKALEKFGVFVPEEYAKKKINTPSQDNPVKFGHYLATEVYECYTCHSASFQTNKISNPELSAGYFGGGNLIESPETGAFLSPNLTMHTEYGVGSYSESEFAKMVRQGIRPGNYNMSSLMPKFSTLSDDEIHAIWEYLKTIPVLEKN